MGLFSAIFGQSARTEMARVLAINRIANLTIQQIDANTQDRLISHIRGMGLTEAMSLPEGTIITIIYSYSELIQKRQPHVHALRQIEQHRSSLGSRPVDYREMSLDDYVAYRLSVELKDGPSPGMDDYWFNTCMSECCKHCKLPWNGGPTERTVITRTPRQ